MQDQVYICSVYDALKVLAANNNAVINFHDDGISCTIAYPDIQVESEHYSSVECLYAWLTGALMFNQVQTQASQDQLEFSERRMDRFESVISEAFKTGTINSTPKQFLQIGDKTVEYTDKQVKS